VKKRFQAFAFKCYLYRYGEVDKTVGNTGGWGGMRGIMYAIGKPVPEPWTLGGKLCTSFPALLGFSSTMVGCVHVV
jgi:hypothetical protein